MVNNFMEFSKTIALLGDIYSVLMYPQMYKYSIVLRNTAFTAKDLTPLYELILYYYLN